MITNKDYGSMKTDVGEFVGDTTSSFLLKIGKYLNFRYRDILRRYQWKHIFGTTTISTVANQATYPLPWDFGELIYVWDNTNKITLYEAKESGEQNDTALVGNPQYFSIKESTVYNQPTAASIVTLVSSSASDTTQTVFVKGTNSAGHVITEELTINGTTNVTSSASFTTVLQVSKSATSVGNFTLTTNSGAVTIAVIGPNQLQARYRVLHLFHIPSAAWSLVVRYKKLILPMVNAYDYPVMDIADELICGAQADAWRAKRQFAKAASLEAMYEGMVQSRMFQEEQNADITIEPTPYDRNS